MAADFGPDVNAHLVWWPEQRGQRADAGGPVFFNPSDALRIDRTS